MQLANLGVSLIQPAAASAADIQLLISRTLIGFFGRDVYAGGLVRGSAYG